MSAFLGTFLDYLIGAEVPVNVLYWDYQMRRVTIGVAAIFACILYYVNESPLICAGNVNAQVKYVNTFCRQATWYDAEVYHVNEDSQYVIPGEQDIRNLNWIYFMIPAAIIVCLIYFVNANSVTTMCVKTAMNFVTKDAGSKPDEDLRSVEMLCKMEPDAARRDSLRDFVSRCLVHAKPTRVLGVNIPIRFNTSYRYYVYLLLLIPTNLVGILVFHPKVEPCKSVIACHYVATNMTTEWTNCVVPGVEWTKVALWIISALYVVNVCVSVLSFIVLFLYPSVVMNASEKAISLYADNVEHEVSLRNYLHNNRSWLKNNSHVKYIMVMVYVHACDAASYVSVACMDVLKDAKLFIISREIQKIFHVKFHRMLIENSSVTPVYRTVISDLGIIGNARHGRKKTVIANGVSRVQIERCKSQKEENERIVSCTEIGDRIPSCMDEEWFDIFSKDFEYSRNFFCLYRVSLKMQDEEGFEEIDYYPCTGTSVADNSHVAGYDARNLFDKKTQYSWKSAGTSGADNSDIWMERKWNVEYDLMVLAIQGPHQSDSMAGPTRFRTSFGHSLEGKVEEPIEFIVNEWLADEWKVFSLCRSGETADDADECFPTTTSLRITMLDNGGEEFYEVQNMKIFGKKALDNAQVL